MAVRLRYLAHDLEVPMGQFLIGRTSDCQLSLDDPLVSRRHAVLAVQTDGVFIEDLGSRNGVFLNGAKVLKRSRVKDGDVVRIGSQDLTLIGIIEAPVAPGIRSRSPHAQTMQDIRVNDLLPPGDDDVQTSVITGPLTASLTRGTVDPGKRIHGLSLVGALADKALQMGHPDDAERLLQRPLAETLNKAQKGEISGDFAEKAAGYALRLAAGTGKGSWINYTFELYMALPALLPARLVDELYAVVRKVKHIDKAVFRAYTERLREMSHGFGPAERFVQQRIEGLERLA